jgi:hypothetical protein
MVSSSGVKNSRARSISKVARFRTTESLFIGHLAMLCAVHRKYFTLMGSGSKSSKSPVGKV